MTGLDYVWPAGQIRKLIFWLEGEETIDERSMYDEVDDDVSRRNAVAQRPALLDYVWPAGQIRKQIYRTMWYVYTLKCRGNKLYVGSTDDLERRLKQHQNGECISTSKLLPVKLISYTAVETRLQARRLEAYLKKGSGKTILKKRILGMMDDNDIEVIGE